MSCIPRRQPDDLEGRRSICILDISQAAAMAMMHHKSRRRAAHDACSALTYAGKLPMFSGCRSNVPRMHPIVVRLRRTGGTLQRP
jgi:hypothetical protein